MNNTTNNKLNNIPKNLFVFANDGERIHDEKLKTKARGFLKDAFYRFKKNKSSVIAAFIIIFLVLFAIFSPVISPYTLQDKNITEVFYYEAPPFIESIAEKNLGIFDGGVKRDSINDFTYNTYMAIYKETGLNPVISIDKTITTKVMYRGQEREEHYYSLTNNVYYEKGVVFRNITVEEFYKIQKFSLDNNLQVILPYVHKDDIKKIENSNIWYKVTDDKGTPKLEDLDGDGEKDDYVPAYSTAKSKSGVDNSVPLKRVDGDDGSYIYSYAKGSAVQVRVNYYHYYTYLYGHEPMYIFGTTEDGYCLFEAIGQGARFSLIFAVIVASINMFLGIIYGSIEGYFGGTTDMVMERISDILSGVPTMVVVTLFQLHLAQKVGAVPSFLFAYIMTGWIGMASLTRKQFYRFKGQEYVLASRTLGARDTRIMFKHIFPNSLGTIITSCALVIPGVIGSETTLTYLGIIDLSKVTGTSLGVLMQQGQNSMSTAPHAMIFPALYFALLMIAFNLFGNGLRDAFNPSTRGEEG